MKKINITIYTVEQIASMFSVKEKTVRGWAKKGLLPTKKIGTRYFFEEKVVLEFFNTFINKNE